MNIENKDEPQVQSFRFDAAVSNGRLRTLLRGKGGNPTGRAGVLVASSPGTADQRDTLRGRRERLLSVRQHTDLAGILEDDGSSIGFIRCLYFQNTEAFRQSFQQSLVIRHKGSK